MTFDDEPGRWGDVGVKVLGMLVIDLLEGKQPNMMRQKPAFFGWYEIQDCSLFAMYFLVVSEFKLQICSHALMVRFFPIFPTFEFAR